VRKGIVFVMAVLVLSGSAAFGAFDVQFYADCAPNKYLSQTAYSSWWADEKADIIAGTVRPMEHGCYCGAYVCDPSEQAVYSFPPFGNRVHWVYWVPNISVNDFVSHGMQAKMRMDYDGVVYTYDFSQGGILVEDSPDAGWTTVTNFEACNGGVIGTFGHAWWVAYDQYAPTAEAFAARDAEIAGLIGHSTFVEGLIRFTASDPQEMSIRVDVAPEPASFVFLGTALVGLVGSRIRSSRRSRPRG